MTLPLPLLFLLQTAPVAPVQFDLATTTNQTGVLSRCDAPRGDEIVVCGAYTVGNRYRLQPLPDSPDERPLRAETRLFGAVDAGIRGEAKQLGSGVTSNRVMVHLKTPF